MGSVVSVQLGQVVVLQHDAETIVALDYVLQDPVTEPMLHDPIEHPNFVFQGRDLLRHLANFELCLHLFAQQRHQLVVKLRLRQRGSILFQILKREIHRAEFVGFFIHCILRGCLSVFWCVINDSM